MLRRVRAQGKFQKLMPLLAVDRPTIRAGRDRAPPDGGATKLSEDWKLRRVMWLLALVLTGLGIAGAQYHQTDVPAEEFRARHARVFEQIGANAVAVVQGVGQTEGFTLPRWS